MANGGNWNTLVATLGGQGTSAGGTGSDAENLTDFDPADIGLPSGGTVTLTITGDVEYDETATVSDDGKVHFRVPPILTGSTITVKLIVKDSTGAVVFSGDTEQTVSGDSLNIAVNLDPFGVIMKTGENISTALQALGTGLARSFVASPTPPAEGATTELLSDTGSPTEVLAWRDGTSIKYYAKGYTDSDMKIPLNADSGFMFGTCERLTSLDVSGFDTRNVTTMASMFSGCRALTSLDLSSFDTHNVSEMSTMFGGCRALTTIYASTGFDTTNVTDSGNNMFSSCRAPLKGGAGTTYSTSNPNDKTYARIDGGTSSPGYFTAR